MQSLDHLFPLPILDVVAPCCYWEDNPAALTSAMLLVRLSDRVWSKVSATIEPPRDSNWKPATPAPAPRKPSISSTGDGSDSESSAEQKLRKRQGTNGAEQSSSEPQQGIEEASTIPEASITTRQEELETDEGDYKEWLLNEEMRERGVRLKDLLTRNYYEEVMVLHYTA